MVDPVIAGAAVTAAAVAAAAGYSYFTGNEASVDTDGDGEDELTFGGNNGMTGCNDPTEDPAYAEDPAPAFEESEEESTFGIEEAGGTSFDTQEPPEDPTPEHVTEKGGLTDVKGIGPTRAEDLGRAGFPNPEDLYYASDENLTDVSGIGDLTVSQIREDIGSVEDEGNGGESSDSTDTDSSSDEESEQSSPDDTGGDGSSSADEK